MEPGNYVHVNDVREAAEELRKMFVSATKSVPNMEGQDTVQSALYSLANLTLRTFNELIERQIHIGGNYDGNSNDNGECRELEGDTVPREWR